MKTRVLAAVVLLPLLLIVVLVLPRIFTGILFGVRGALASYELLSGTSLVKHPRLLIYSSVMAFATSIWCSLGGEYAVALLGILVYCGVLFGEMMRSHVKITFEHVAYCLVAGLLIPFLFTSVVRIHAVRRTGRYFILIPFVLAFLSDTGAYFAGRAFGQHKLAPVISPKKTIEGVIGGAAAGIVGMLIYAVIYGLLGSLGAVFGDLCFSVIKRQTGIKDYGKLIPGHGGVLDRFDSMMIVGPLTEVFLLLIPIAVK